MQNDAKLGLVAGVAGVVVAGILFAQPQPTAAPPAAKVAPVAPTSVSLPAPKPQPAAVTASRARNADD